MSVGIKCIVRSVGSMGKFLSRNPKEDNERESIGEMWWPEWGHENCELGWLHEPSIMTE